MYQQLIPEIMQNATNNAVTVQKGKLSLACGHLTTCVIHVHLFNVSPSIAMHQCMLESQERPERTAAWQRFQFTMLYETRKVFLPE